MASIQLLVAVLIGTVVAVTASTPPWRNTFLQPSPANNETIDVGTYYTIEWQTNGTASADVDIYLMSGAQADALSVYVTISGVPDNGSYTWLIPYRLVDQGYFALRMSPSPNPYSLSVTSSQFELDVLKAENPCYDGDRCYPPLPPGWHHRLAIVLGSIIGGLALLCAGGCFCMCRTMRRRRRRNEAALENFRRTEEQGAAPALYQKEDDHQLSAATSYTQDNASPWSKQSDDVELTGLVPKYNGGYSPELNYGR